MYIKIIKLSNIFQFTWFCGTTSADFGVTGDKALTGSSTNCGGSNDNCGTSTKLTKYGIDLALS